MATLTTQQIRDISTYWANINFVIAQLTAVYSIDDLNAAVTAIDNAFDTTINAAQTAGHGTQTLLQALNSVIPTPVSGATSQQKAELVCFTISKRFGLI